MMEKQTLDLTSLKDAVASLEASLAVVGNVEWFTKQTEAVQNTLIAGVIQNFEFVYELSIKMVRRQIEVESDSPEEVDKTNFRDIIRMAAEKGMVEDVEAWFAYREMRNITAHTYDHEKAQRIYTDTLKFFKHSKALLIALEKRNGR